MKSPRLEIKTEGSVESSKEGLAAIHDVAMRARELVENECSKGTNSWHACVRTFLGRIMSESQLLNSKIVTPEYKNRVEIEGAEILGELKQLEGINTHILDEADVSPTDAEPKKHVAPPEEVRGHIYSLIFNLAPQQNELL